MTTCILGNSHAATLLGAYRALPDASALDWDFFVVPNGHANGLNGIRYDPDSNALTGFKSFRSDHGPDLQIARYDTFVLVGAHGTAVHIAAGLNTEMSDRFRAAAVAEACQAAPLYRLAEQIRAVSTARLVLMPKPAPRVSRRFDGTYREPTDRCLRAFWATLGAEVVTQPAETLDDQGMTLEDCFKSPSDNHYHPEAAQLALQALRNLLDTPPAIRRSA